MGRLTIDPANGLPCVVWVGTWEQELHRTELLNDYCPEGAFHAVFCGRTSTRTGSSCRGGFGRSPMPASLCGGLAMDAALGQASLCSVPGHSHLSGAKASTTAAEQPHSS